MRSQYRFSAPFVARLLGIGLVGIGLAVLLVVALALLFSVPGVVTLAMWVVLVALLALGLALGLLSGLLASRRAAVVTFDDVGYRIRYVRGTGVRQAEWRQVEDVAAATVAGVRCVVLRLRDGRTSTVPLGVLAGRPEDFLRDLRAHLNRGHGYRPAPKPRR